jgi:predicted nucleic acid-binding protein
VGLLWSMCLVVVGSGRKGMAGILFDTSVYITALRQGGEGLLERRRARLTRDGKSQPLWLSAVVLAELYAGAAEKGARQQLLRFERTFASLNRLLVPTQQDWSLAGQVLAQLGKKYGYEQAGRTRLVHDTLIAMSAARRGLTIVTYNEEDFRRVAEFRPLSWVSAVEEEEERPR